MISYVLALHRQYSTEVHCSLLRSDNLFLLEVLSVRRVPDFTLFAAPIYIHRKYEKVSKKPPNAVPSCPRLCETSALPNFQLCTNCALLCSKLIYIHKLTYCQCALNTHKILSVWSLFTMVVACFILKNIH